jgi:arsenical pump membrane protein
MGGCILALATAPYIGIEMWVVAFAFALALIILLTLRDSLMALREREVIRARTFSIGTAAHRMPWSIVPFVASLFITIEALRIAGITGEAGRVLSGWGGGSVVADTYVYGILSALAANVLNNIPMTVAFVPILGVMQGENLLAAVLATAIGSNLGANITPLGSLAGIMWMSILRDKEVRITFGEFVTYGLIVTPLTLIAALGVLAVECMVW